MIAYIASSRDAAIRILKATLPDHTIDHTDKVWSPARLAPIGIIAWDQDRLHGRALSCFVDLDGAAAHNIDLRNVLLSRIFRCSFDLHMRANIPPRHFFVGVDEASNEQP